MIENPILDSIKQMTGFSEVEIKNILENFDTKFIKKKTTILATGAISKEIYLILSGCMRLFYEKDGEEISAYFFTEGMFAGSYESFISQQPARHTIEALEDCEVLSIQYENWQELLLTVPRMNEFVRKILEVVFISLHQLFTSQILESPEERYLNLMKYKPGLMKRIPQHHIATFLGITPVSLSRIRNRVAKK